MLKRISIAGGGLAGLALGIALRDRGVPVSIWEAGGYPRHKVCGEFICGDGLRTLEEMGLLARAGAAGGFEGRTARFFVGVAASEQLTLPSPALCIARFALDAWLAREFQERGGELIGRRVQAGGALREGEVRATGRRPVPAAKGGKYFGLKAHVQGLALDSSLEMHLTPNGYVGLCQLPGGKVNVCGMFRRTQLLDAPEEAKREGHQVWNLLRGEPGSALYERLKGKSFESHCSVAGLALVPLHWKAVDEFCVGDALVMTPPITGNGMSMALESAAIGAAVLEEYSRGGVAWGEAVKRTTELCRARFGGRLRIAGWLHRFLFAPMGRGAVAGALIRSPGLLRRLFQSTR